MMHRVVLDTNIVVSALIFNAGRLAWIRHGWQHQQLPEPWPDLPVCCDEKDQVFPVLAHVGEADALITGDADILVLGEDFPGLIMTAEAFAARQA